MSHSSTEQVWVKRIVRDEGALIGQVTLNIPDKLNILNSSTTRQLRDAVTALSAESDLRVLVLGDFFCFRLAFGCVFFFRLFLFVLVDLLFVVLFLLLDVLFFRLGLFGGGSAENLYGDFTLLFFRFRVDFSQNPSPASLDGTPTPEAGARAGGAARVAQESICGEVENEKCELLLTV